MASCLEEDTRRPPRTRPSAIASRKNCTIWSWSETLELRSSERLLHWGCTEGSGMLLPPFLVLFRLDNASGDCTRQPAAAGISSGYEQNPPWVQPLRAGRAAGRICPQFAGPLHTEPAAG